MADVKIASLTENTSPTDTNIMIIEDNSDTKKITFANIKATLKTYFDGLYATVANLNLKAPLSNPVFTGTQTLPNIVTNGVKFPATQVPSADPNTLDDYEKGTWTPIPVPATGAITSYTSRGYYTKTGNTVTIVFDCQLTNAGTGAGNLKITGLPFTPKINFLGIVGLEPFNTGVAIYGYINGTEIQAIKQLTNDASIVATLKGPSMMFTYLTN